jgi:hypothetical protein
MDHQIFDNDDDLFSDHSSQKQNNNSSTDFDSFIEQTKEIIDSKNMSTTQFVIRTGMMTAFYELCNNFIFENESFGRTLFSTINRITDNQFQFELYADVLEESILKRFSIKQFLESVLSEETISTIENNSFELKIEIDKLYMNNYFGSMLKIMNHSIERNIQIYEKLCLTINRTPIKQIVDRDYYFVDSFSFNVKDQINSSFSSIKQSLGFNTY